MLTRNPFCLLSSLSAVLTLSVSAEGGSWCGSPGNPVQLQAKFMTVQYLTSPGYPDDFPDNSNCAWAIQATHPLYVVQLSVIDRGTQNCPYDSITVFDGDSDSDAVLKGFCTASGSRYIFSSGRNMYIQFRSAEGGSGFRLSYQAFPPSLHSTSRPILPVATPPNKNANTVVGAAVGAGIGGVIIIFCCAVGCYSAMAKRDQSGRPRAVLLSTSTPTTTTTTTRQPPPSAPPTVYQGDNPASTSGLTQAASASTSTTARSHPSAPPAFYLNSNPVTPASTPGPPQAAYDSYSNMAAGTGNAAHPPSADDPPSYWSLQHGSSTNRSPSEPVSATGSPPSPPPPSYTEATEMTSHVATYV